MAVFKVQAPDGSIIKVEAADQATAIRGAQEHYASRKTDVLGDMGQSFMSGLGQGVSKVVGAVGDVREMPGNIAASVAGLAGKAGLMSPEVTSAVQEGARQGGRASAGMVEQFAPTSDQVNTVRQQALGKDHEPQTEAGRLARAVGQNIPNALLPGGIAGRVINVVAPAVGGQVGRKVVKAAGGGETAQDVGETVGSVLGGVAGNVRLPAKAPGAAAAKPLSVDELRAAKNAAYQAVDESGVQYSPDATKRLAASVQAAVGDEIDPDLHSNLTAVIKRRIDSLAKGDGQPITLSKLDKVRQVINDDVLTAQASRGERRLAYKVRDALDQFVASAGPEDVIGASDPEAAADSLKTARNLNTRVAKIEAIQEAADRAVRRTGRTGSGGNIDNATRQEIGKAAVRQRGWTPDEKAALDRIEIGTPGQNTLRQIGKFSPKGNGLSQWMNVGAAVKTGGLSLPITAAGIVAKHMADGMTKSAVDNVVKLIASGGDAELAQMSRGSPQVASLVADLRGVNLRSPTVNALLGYESTRSGLGSAQTGR
jgi:hypothetical protein